GGARRLFRRAPERLIHEARATDEQGAASLEVAQGTHPGGVDEGDAREVEQEGRASGEVRFARRAQGVAVAAGDASLHLKSSGDVPIRDLRDPHHAGETQQAACRDGARRLKPSNSATWPPRMAWASGATARGLASCRGSTRATRCCDGCRAS